MTRSRFAASLVVVAFHRPRELAGLLEATRSPAIEQIVVNVETDRAVTEAASSPDVRVLDLPMNGGYARAVNAGAAWATADVVVFANDDICCDAETVLALAARSGDIGGVIVPAIFDASGARVSTIHAALSVRALFFEWALLPDKPLPLLSKRNVVEKWRDPSGPEQIDAASAVMVAVPRAALLSEPLFEDLFMYWEEAEWFVRIRRRGIIVEYRPELTVTHLGGRSITSPAKQVLLARNAVRSLRRLYGVRAAALGWAVTMGWHSRLVFTGILRLAWTYSSAQEDRRTARVSLRARWAGLGAAIGAWREVAS